MQTVDAAGLAIGDGHPPRVMGVLNLSAESPYDPSVFEDPGEAARYVDEELVTEGADIVDVGLESANKRFEVLSPEAELERLETAISAIESVSGDPVFSIETRYAEVAAAALDRGFDMVNDICGFADPELPAVCEARDAAVVKMASPPDLERPGALDTVDEIHDALATNGLTERTIVDPAFGGWSETKTLETDRETFRRLREFRSYGQPVLVSINRKNFLGDLVDRETEDRLPASLAATAMAIERGVHVVRTHDVAETVDAVRIGDAFASQRPTERIDGIDVDWLAVADAADLERHLVAVDGDPGQATAGVAAAVRLAGLTTAEHRALATAAREVGAHLAPADPAEGDPGAVLFGTRAALGRLELPRGEFDARGERGDRLVRVTDTIATMVR